MRYALLEHARGQLPDGVEAELGPLSTGLGEIFQYTVEGSDASLMERRAVQDWLIAPRLRAVPGVTEVNSFGGEVEQVQVVVSPTRLLAHGLTLRAVEEAVARGNTTAGAGYIVRGWEQLLIRGEALYASPTEIEDVVLTTGAHGTPVVLRDVATVTTAGAPVRQGAMTRDGAGETVGGMVIMLRGENSRSVVGAVKRAVAELTPSLPNGLRLDVFYDRTELVEACLDTVTGALFQGALLVSVVLALFLAEVRTAAVVVISLPVTFLLVEAMAAELATIPGLRFAFSQPIALRVNELVSGVKGDLAIKAFGPDLEQLKHFADRAAVVLRGIRGARDVKVEQVAGMVEVVAELDRAALARWGLAAKDVTDTMEAALAGRTVTRMLVGERRVDVVVRYPSAMRSDLDSLGRLLVATPGGATVQLGRVATLASVEGPMVIGRENGMRRVVVEANVRGRDLGTFVAAARTALAPLAAELPAGSWLEYGGQFEQQQRAMRQLMVVVPVALVLVVVLLYAALGSLRDAALVLVNLPFALVGGVIAAAVFGLPLSVSAAVAFIALLGIAVQNGVVLVAFFRQLRARGASLDEAVTEGCRLRFKPLLMTALTTFIGYAPLVWASGAGADVQRPLAVIVMGGVVSSTLLTLVVLPVLYRAMAHLCRHSARLRPAVGQPGFHAPCHDAARGDVAAGRDDRPSRAPLRRRVRASGR